MQLKGTQFILPCTYTLEIVHSMLNKLTSFFTCSSQSHLSQS